MAPIDRNISYLIIIKLNWLYLNQIFDIILINQPYFYIIIYYILLLLLKSLLSLFSGESSISSFSSSSLSAEEM